MPMPCRRPIRAVPATATAASTPMVRVTPLWFPRTTRSWAIESHPIAAAGALLHNSGDVPPQHIRWNGVYDLPVGRGKQFVKTSPLGWTRPSAAGRSPSSATGAAQLDGVSSSLHMFGNPALSSSQRVITNIFGGSYKVYFKAISIRPSRDQRRRGPATRSGQRGQRVLTKVGNQDNLVDQTLADGTVVQTSVGDLLSWNARTSISDRANGTRTPGSPRRSPTRSVTNCFLPATSSTSSITRHHQPQHHDGTPEHGPPVERGADHSALRQFSF